MVTTATSTSASRDTIVDVLAEESVLRDGTDSLDSSRQLTVSLSKPAGRNFNPFGKWGYQSDGTNDSSGSILVEHGNSTRNTLSIILHRTIRVPDNADTNSLPPSLGSFPLFRVSDYTHNLPDEIVHKGGIFFPMYQSEAMWMAFTASRPFALKIYVGGVNAVSGFPMVENDKTREKRARMLKENKEIQDYVVTPNQPWLDGIVSEDGKIRQFIAQPKGSGFSVEAQVTGEEKVGGIQIEIIPVKKNFPDEFDVRYKDKEDKVLTRTFKLQERGITRDSTWDDVKTIISKEFGIKEDEQQLSQHTPTPTGPYTSGIDFDGSLRLGDVYFPPKFSTLGVEHSRGLFGGVGRAPYGGRKSIFAETSTDASGGGGGLFGAASQNTNFNPYSSASGAASGGLFAKSAAPSGGAGGLMMMKSCAVPPPPPAPMQLMQSAAPTTSLFGAPPQQMQSTAQPATASLFGAPTPEMMAAAQQQAMQQQQSQMQAQSTTSLFGAAGASMPRAKPKVKEMGLAAGGLIKQTINADPNPADVWDKDAAVLLHLQIFDPASYTDVTGNPAPPTPATQEEYAKHGWPYFELWNEEKTGVKGDFSEVKSVAQMKKERALAAGEDAPAEEESVPVRVVTIGQGRVVSFKSTFRPLEVLRKELQHLTLSG
ncbi:integral membrane protein [Plectosphaerella plurivora]|uniref:Integral membrane protein n=1 Tax=Plectosphaerella plurivora TaxID=936078 RepID=A0A9P8VAJ1_9PEZI|nr:integral membrane protein [Plectosphaerella plurivora]